MFLICSSGVITQSLFLDVVFPVKGWLANRSLGRVRRLRGAVAMNLAPWREDVDRPLKKDVLAQDWDHQRRVAAVLCADLAAALAGHPCRSY